MTQSEVVRSRRAQYDEIQNRLEAKPSGRELDAVKKDIVALFKLVEQEIVDLGALKEEIRELVDAYKALAAEEARSQQGDGSGESAHQDHLGASTFIEKGWSLMALGDHQGAIEAMRKALELSPGDAQAESQLGWAQMLNQEYDEALGTFQQVLMKEPANALARINVGYICLKKRIFGEAIEHLSKAIRLDNDKKATLYAHYYLGLVYFEREMFDDAQTFFEKTLTLGPNMIEAWYQLGQAKWYARDVAGARQAWEDGERANKFNPWGKRCREALGTVDDGREPPRY